MVAGLIKMQNAGDGKEDREDDRGGFVGGIVPEAAVDWEVLDRWWLRGEIKGRHSPYFPSSMMDMMVFETCLQW
jgi:hypothetical protein